VDPTTGTEKVLYSFCGQQDCADGEEPEAALLSLHGVLYGTTTYGGTVDEGCCGTLFSFDPQTEVETVIYSFCSQQYRDMCPDGQYPTVKLLNVKGTLYGTTNEGGSYANCTYGCGTVFAIKP
jgi:uncharacterized repeat protein (TIGR03803 family)